VVPTVQENRASEGRKLPEQRAAEQAKALAVVLREEFGVGFVLFDAADGSVAYDADGQWSQENDGRLAPPIADELVADGRARVVPLPDGQYQLGLLCYASRKPAFVALAEIDSLARTEAYAGRGNHLRDEREQAMLQAWLQAVSDRLRLADQLVVRRRAEEAQNSQVTASFEALLALDHLTRRLRVHKDPVKNQLRILESAFGLIKVQTVVWVPHQSEQAVLHHGEFCLKQDECRQLARALAQSPDFKAGAPLVHNDVRETAWGTRFPKIENLMAFHVTGPLGWFIVLNKKDPTGRGAAPFRRSDAALVLPFVGLFELHLRWSHRHQGLQELLTGLTRSLTTALDAKDAYTYGHSERVARTAVELGREIGLDGDELGDIYLSGLLHDVGKIGIRDTVLHKPGALTQEEREHIQQHVLIGYSILADLRQIRSLLPGVLYHHERVDGKGYPDGLAGDNIPLLARILAVADAYDAMSNPRPYRAAMPSEQVEETLRKGAGTQWDEQVVDAFFRCLQRIHAIRNRGVGDSLRRAIDGALRSVSGSDTASVAANLQPLPGTLRAEQ
jgi:HD-GYP domain-containing protein (c-di-GMP phosphodiesterase class II)